MKSLLLLTVFISFNVFAQDKYVFGEFHFGLSEVDSSVNEEKNNKNGSYQGLGLGYEYKFKNNWNLNTSLSYTDHTIETELVENNRYTKVELEAQFLHLNLNPTYSLTKNIDLGFNISTAVSSDGVLISQEETLNTTVGLNAFYNVHLGNDKMRVGLAVNTGSVDSRYTSAGMTIQYAFGIVNKQSPTKRKENYTTITFEEDVVRFKNDSAEMSIGSKAFLAEVATFLSENSYLWESVIISGHTSLVGEEDYNKYLSYKRANTVFQVFKEMGVPQGKINIEGLGESKPKHLVEKTKKQAYENRRVELKFVKMRNDKEFKRFIEILKKKHKK